MNRTRARLAGFAAVLGVVFVGGWAVGAQFPTDQGSDHPAHTETPADDHLMVPGTDPGMDHGDAP